MHIVRIVRDLTAIVCKFDTAYLRVRSPPLTSFLVELLPRPG